MTSPDIMRFGVTSTTPATRRRNLLGEDRKSGVAHTGKVAGRLLADFAFRYDAAGRLVKEGDRTFRYGSLDKVLSDTEGERTYTYDYHVDGQLARAVYGNGTGDDGRAVSTKPPPPASSEDFLWDGLALIKRGDERFLNEPHVGGGNPVASSKGTTYFNDILGTTVGIREGRAPSRPKSPRYSAAALTAFGESIPASQPLNTSTSQQFFTGKPQVAGLGHAFLFRNYRAGLAKWQTADPLGYPDGWNQQAYCNNNVIDSLDYMGGEQKFIREVLDKHNVEPPSFYRYAFEFGHWYMVYLIISWDECHNVYRNTKTVPTYDWLNDIFSSLQVGGSSIAVAGWLVTRTANNNFSILAGGTAISFGSMASAIGWLGEKLEPTQEIWDGEEYSGEKFTKNFDIVELWVLIE